MNVIHTNAVIDIKDIPECRTLQFERHHLALGSALTLTEITENGGFPLLSKAAREVADHTARNKITLGGNICGQIFYREAVLPFINRQQSGDSWRQGEKALSDSRRI